MNTAEGIVCRIPSDTAVKVSEFFCSVERPVLPADAQAFAAWAGVIVTAIALLFARGAWNEARNSNNIAISQLEKSVQGVEKQIDAQRKTTLEQMQLEQLGKYCETLISFVKNSRHFSENLTVDLQSGIFAEIAEAERVIFIEMEERIHEVRSRWTSWAMYLIGDDPTLREATNAHLILCIDAAEGILKQETSRHVNSTFDPNEIRESFANREVLALLEVLILDTAKYVFRLQQVMLRASYWKEIRVELIEQFSTKPEA